MNKNKTELIQYPIGNLEISYKIPSTITSIESWAFYYAKSLIYITIPSSVKIIRNNAFGYCSSLRNLIFEGTSEPNCDYETFTGSLVVTFSFPNGYCENSFCDKSVEQTLSC